jgi:ketosteroid isomerase-like protein
VKQKKNNRIVLWLFLLMALAGYAVIGRTQAPNPITEIVSLLQKHDQALNQKDLDALMSLYSTDDTTVLMGAGPGEKWVGKGEIGDAYKHFFQDFDKGSLTRDCFWKTSASNGDVAWLSAICKMGDSLKGRKREYGLNISAVFERQGGAWLIRSMGFSNPTGSGVSGTVSQKRR